MHLFLSPHLDDAVLSCGGLIHQLVAAGEEVIVRTIMAGDPPSPPPDTPLIRDLHGRWAAGANPMLARRAEDQCAMERLGVRWEHLAIPDCPYRVDEQGRALYPENADLFGQVHPADPVLHMSMNIPPSIQRIYAPLGAGGHVDHLVVRELARRLPFEGTILYYEEYPYSASGGEAVRIGNDAGRLYGSAAVHAALAVFDPSLHPQVMRLHAEDIIARIQAVACYTSQISTFWDDLIDMEKRVRAYAQSIAEPFGERYWA